MRKDQTLPPSPPIPVQFFVRLFPGGKTLVIRAHSTDPVEFIHYKIMTITGIPAVEQRLIYRGKQLQPEQTLADCGIQKDESMQLVGRLRSVDHPQARQLINGLISLIFDIFKSKNPSIPSDSDSDRIIRMLIGFLTMTPKDTIEKAREHIKIFISSSAPTALVMLYMSPDSANKFTADKSVRSFISSYKSMLPKRIYVLCTPIVLQFCKLLRGAGLDDSLYKFCRSSLGDIAESTGILRRKATAGLLALKDEIVSSESLVPSPVRMLKDLTRVQFFVRLFPGGKTLVIQAHSTDLVESIHYKIMRITGIPTADQRLIYKGKQLQSEQTLANCGIQKDESMQLVGRMRSTDHPQAWQLINDLVSLIFDILRSNYPSVPSDSDHIIRMLIQFLTMTPGDNIEKAYEHIKIFVSSSAPAALVMLYMSPDNANKFTADESVRSFVNSFTSMLPKHICVGCARIVLEFCKLLRGAAGLDDRLYNFCRSSLGAIVDSIGNARHTKELLALKDVFMFVCEVVVPELSHALELSKGSVESTGGLSVSIVRDFTEYMLALKKVIPSRILFVTSEAVCVRECIKCLHRILYDLLDKMELCLKKLEAQLGLKEIGKGKPIVPWWSLYLVILKELNSISKLFKGLEKIFWQKMKQRKVSLCFLIVASAKRSNDYRWILEHKEVTNFEVRRHFAMMMLREVRNGNQALHEMLIDRSQLLAESFEYIRHADPALLRGSLFMEFKHEEATGPGVLREWFFLVCRAIFNSQNALFVACPNDRRRFFPNPASKVDPLHLEYFCFSGRMIALALMHKIQIGVVFDRVFFLQLAGEEISLEDIRDADPYMYSSCKQILEMDPETVDQDILGLTFVCEVEELGSRKVVELCLDGKDTVVNSKNRKKYVNLLIQHLFVTSIAQQVAHFSQGFADITTSRLQTSFFRSLDLEDLDWMLDGNGSTVSVEDWKAHTDYKGYKESDPQISWFWKIVGRMSAEQRKVLLFFWTSIKHLPLEGFGGLASRLYICRTSESYDHLPSAHTCFYHIRFPPYQSMAVMQDRLRVITQEHVGCSFGTW
ncbi:PREDICTED: E3 ubiquitin-protein ligase UPL5-like [Nicotiana attenuata]|uniref:HECT-type E3 ubiquitin transferase n=1 Tax=Nicotiana attenuata TaxID=49451 RepID=A0A1J6LAQ3_NICAT|nr:PREDICTED: E3 ubiquitin-protein ligase UPL5-like [Nicotiana attenuata]OIT28105.1 e3 ubiquitin-protein ligase upl5 [Nicotiana attenuata]